MAESPTWGKAAVAQMSPDEREQRERDARLAAFRFQYSAYRAFRHSIAAATVVIGLVVGADLVRGGADGPHRWPGVVALAAALLGVGYFAVGPRPTLAMRLLRWAVTATVVALLWLSVIALGAAE